MYRTLNYGMKSIRVSRAGICWMLMGFAGIVAALQAAPVAHGQTIREGRFEYELPVARTFRLTVSMKVAPGCE